MSKLLASYVILVVSIQAGTGAEMPVSHPIVRGFSVRTHLDSRGDEHRYALFVPHSSMQGEKFPVLMFLNGLGQNGSDGVNQIKNNFGLPIWEMQEFFPFLAIAPQCRTGSSWNEDTDDTRWAMEILNVVVDEFSADQDRILLTGVSVGGTGVWRIASKHSDRFAAIVPLCGHAEELDRLIKARVPIWNFINDGDNEDLLSSTRRARDRLIREGQSPLFTEFREQGHDCWNVAYRLPTLYAWLLEQRRSRNSSELLFEYLPPNQLKSKLQQRDLEGVVFREVEGEVLAAAGGESERLLIFGKAEANFEVHMDIWLDEQSSSQLALVPDENGSQGQQLRLDLKLVNIGCGGVFRFPSNEWLADTGLAAQQSLKARRWNDVRVRLLNGHLTVKINGWLAIDREVAPAGAKHPSYRVGIVVPPGAKEVRWRYVRHRPLAPK